MHKLQNRHDSLVLIMACLEEAAFQTLIPIIEIEIVVYHFPMFLMIVIFEWWLWSENCPCRIMKIGIRLSSSAQCCFGWTMDRRIITPTGRFDICQALISLVNLLHMPSEIISAAGRKAGLTLGLSRSEGFLRCFGGYDISSRVCTS